MYLTSFLNKILFKLKLLYNFNFYQKILTFCLSTKHQHNSQISPFLVAETDIFSNR